MLYIVLFIRHDVRYLLYLGTCKSDKIIPTAFQNINDNLASQIYIKIDQYDTAIGILISFSRKTIAFYRIDWNNMF